MKKWKSLRIFILGVLLYFSPKSVFFTFAAKWFPDPRIPDGLMSRVNVMRRNFWRSVRLAFISIGLVLNIQLHLCNVVFSTKHWLQVVGVFIALTGALGRGGTGILSMPTVNFFERIDYGMFVISQLGVTCILLFVLLL